MAALVPNHLPPQERIQLLGQARQLCTQQRIDELRAQEQVVTNDIYRNQLLQSRLLLIMVILLTLSGVALAAVQLWASYKLALRGKGALAEGGDVSLGTGSVAVKSSVVGVVILALSFAFFYVYVTEVYRLRALEVGAAQVDSPPPGATEVPR